MPNHISNGVFETNTATSAGQVPSGWTATEGTPDLNTDGSYEWSGSYMPSDLDASDGGGYATMFSTSAYDEGLSTTLGTQVQAGQTYTFSFDYYVNDTDGTNNQPGATDLVVTIGTQTITVPIDSTGATAPYWQSTSVTFTATETTSYFALGTSTDGGSLTYTGVALDNLELDIAPDYIVEGTGGNDTIDVAYVGDPEGDMIDAGDHSDGSDADSVLAGAGDDSVVSGAGNDTVFGADGSDTILGGAGDDNLDGDDVFATGGADSIDGGAGNDQIIGDVGNDILAGDFGNDTVYAGADDDSVSGGDGSDQLFGDDGHDSIRGGEGVDTLDGGAGNDTLNGGDGSDIVYAGAGDDYVTTTPGLDLPGNSDTVFGGTGDDTLVGYFGVQDLSGGDGNDLITGDGNVSGTGGAETLFDLSETDTLSGGAGNDTIYSGYAGTTNGTGDIIDGGTGEDSLVGGTSHDTIDGGADADTVAGGAGSDSILGDLGNDSIAGDAGDDTARGGIGNDTIDGGIGNDSLHGNEDDDSITGGDGSDSIYGETGNDIVSGDGGNDTVEGGSGDDTISGGAGEDFLRGSFGNDSLASDAGDDSLWGGYGDDTFSYTDGFGNDTVEGEEANETDGDTLDLSGVTSDLTVDLTSADPEAGSFTDGTATTNFVEIENIVLGGGNDTLVLGTGGGNDSVQGFTIPTDNGDGTYTANDQLDVSTLTDANGAPVNTDDVTVTDDGNGNAVLTFPGGETLTLAGITPADLSDPAVLETMGIPQPDYIVEGTGAGELIDGSYLGDPEGDVIDGSDDASGGNTDSVVAGGGDDTVFSYVGNDSVDAGVGNDSVDGGSGDDALIGGAGNDTLQGWFDDDSLSGGAGDDNLIGWTGNDTLEGGAGDDSIAGGDEQDLIILEDGFGTDTIDGGDGGVVDADTLDMSGLTNDTTIDLTSSNPEAGSVTSGTDGATFGDIENLVLGSGTDTVALADGSGADTVEGFAAPTDNGDGTFAGNDQLDVSGLTSDGGTTPVTTDDVTVGDDGSGNAVLTFPGGESITLVGVAPSEVDSGPELAALGIPQGAVDGTSGDDTMSPGYTDAQGDVVDGPDGNPDTILAGAGNDSIDGGAGNDTIYSGAGNDTVDNNSGDDQVFLESGDDLFVTDPTLDNETVDGGSGTDTMDLTSLGYDLSGTLDVNETGTLSGSGDNITLSDFENIILTGGDNIIDASATDEGITWTSGDGNDSIDAGGGDDTFIASGGENTYVGGETNETDGDTFDASGMPVDITWDLTSADAEAGTASAPNIPGAVTTFSEIENIVLGSGTDTLVLADGSGADSVQNFSAPIDNGDGTYTGRDQLDVSGMTDADGNPVNVLDVTVSDTNGDGTGDAVLTFPGGESITLEGVSPTQVDSHAGLEAMGIPGTDYIVEGTGGNDVIDGGYAGDPEGDMVDAGDNAAGNDEDSIEAGAGNDTIVGGLGNDTVRADEGDDSVEGASGDDSIYGFEGSDTVFGGDGDDWINTRTSPGTGLPDEGYTDTSGTGLSYPGDTDAGNDRDSVDGGVGNDVILTGDDDDTVLGGLGDDTVNAGFDDDDVAGGSGADSLEGGEGEDTIDGGADNDLIYGDVSPDNPNVGTYTPYELPNDGTDDAPGNNADSLSGGDGDDSIYGQDDNDTLAGGAGDDLLEGGLDDDLLTGGAGSDALAGGAGNDTLVTSSGDSAQGGDGDDHFTIDDALTDGTAIDIFGGEGDETLGDTLDFQGLVHWDDVAYTNTDPGTGGGLAGTATLGDGTIVNFDEIENVIICFTAGTRIATPRGAREVETLAPGDLVITRDNGLQPIRWVGTRTVPALGSLAPVTFAPGVLGNARALRVSPQHRMLLQGPEASLLFGESEVLATAKHLVNGGTVAQTPGGEISYVHILFDQHEIVYAEGAPSESFFPGGEGLDAVEEAAREELFTLFPELRSHAGAFGETARLCLKAYESKLLGLG